MRASLSRPAAVSVARPRGCSGMFDTVRIVDDAPVVAS